MIAPKQISEPIIGILELTYTCFNCKEDNKVMVSAQGWDEYRGGVHVQNAFPSMPAEQRELLISATCGKCWEELFPAEEDADE